MNDTMRALEQTSLNGPQDMRLVHIDVPRPGRGEVLVRVTAAGVNFADVSQTRGTYHGGPRAPYIAGFEAVGEVVELGEGVMSPAKGDHVIGTGPGAFAEYVVLTAAEAMPVPDGWADEQALGLVLNRATALAALKLGRLERGETVLVQAAAGGVGQAAVTLAKHHGATVIATASPGKHELVRALGADHVVSRVDEVSPVDLVLESVGGESFDTALATAKKITGRVVVYGLAGGEAAITNRDLVFKHQVQLIGLHIGVLARSAPHFFAELMAELRDVVTPGDPAVHDLADGPRVLAQLEARTTVGKLALRP